MSEEADSSQSADLAETFVDLAKSASDALNGAADAMGLSEKVERAPYAMLSAALGVGYVLGGGLFTPTTGRLLRLGAKLAAIPQVRERLLDVAEAAIDGVLASAKEVDKEP